MEKFTAFNLYARNEHGGWQTKSDQACYVYRADDVHALLKKVRDEIVSSSGLRNEYQDFNDALAAIDSVLMGG
jgi:hypothetical protein